MPVSVLPVYCIVDHLAFAASTPSLKVFFKKASDITICASFYFIKHHWFDDLSSLFTALKEGEWYYNRDVIKKNRNVCRRDYLRNCGDEIKNSISNINIQGLFNNKLWQSMIVFIVEVANSYMPEKHI